MLSISRTEQAITPVEAGITELAPSGLVQELSSSGIKLSSYPTGHCFFENSEPKQIRTIDITEKVNTEFIGSKTLQQILISHRPNGMHARSIVNKGSLTNLKLIANHK
ncbi:MAG: hypothetical protein IPG90_16650 [Bacteroidetes bacterium]|nr:hypothetical protein [Bacteroidota bacterium]